MIEPRSSGYIDLQDPARTTSSYATATLIHSDSHHAANLRDMERLLLNSYWYTSAQN